MHALRFLSLVLIFAASPRAADYPLGPDSKRQQGVPQGRIEQFQHTSKVYPDSVRDVWVRQFLAGWRHDLRGRVLVIAPASTGERPATGSAAGQRT